jgi:hypothetical protein
VVVVAVDAMVAVVQLAVDPLLTGRGVAAAGMGVEVAAAAVVEGEGKEEAGSALMDTPRRPCLSNLPSNVLHPLQPLLLHRQRPRRRQRCPRANSRPGAASPLAAVVFVILLQPPLLSPPPQRPLSHPCCWARLRLRLRLSGAASW